MRVINPDMINWVRDRRDGYCLYGLSERKGCIPGLHVHHITTKGSGGGDIKENLITLCPRHHQEAQEHKISPEKLRSILTKYFGYQYKE